MLKPGAVINMKNDEDDKGNKYQRITEKKTAEDKARKA